MPLYTRVCHIRIATLWIVTYRVEVDRDTEGGWRIQVLDLDWVHVDRLADIPPTATTLIAATAHVSPESVDLEYTWPRDISSYLEEVESHRAAARMSTREATRARRDLARHLRAEGETLASIGVVLGVTRARANEILRG